MARAEFEEREFETPLYQQLRVANNSVWSPGQVFENHVGFDYSALCVDSYFWAIHGIRNPYNGFVLAAMTRRYAWKRQQNARLLPNFALNLFLQAKRPETRIRLTNGLKGLGLRAPFWRITLDGDQQRILESLSRATKGKALVCYATPAFHRLSQLYAHTSSGTIVENSSFPEANWLKGHDAWNYDCAGATGVANSDPTFIAREGLYGRISVLIKENANSAQTPYDVNLLALAENVIACAEGSQLGVEARGALFFQRKAEVDAYIGSVDLGRYENVIRAFLIILAFAATFRLQWYVVGG